MSKLLVIGKTPPPVGGVTIHVSRLLSELRARNFRHGFILLSARALIIFPFVVCKHGIVHIHSSNPFVRLYLIVFSKLLFVKTVVTFHGDLDRYASSFKNLMDKLTVRLSWKPIVLNENSLSLASKINRNCELLSSFIPPSGHDLYLDPCYISRIKVMNGDYELLFCVNASNLTYDKYGEEIYGIFELIDVFRKFKNYGLVLSDPSGAYFKEFSRMGIVLPSNIYHINKPHSFFKIMEMCSVSIRNTTTDGDSISVRESLYLKKITLATDVVNRPKGCLVYRKGDIASVIDAFSPAYGFFEHEDAGNVVDRLIAIYASV